MNQPLKNIISIVLLAFYLAGFCGIHLLKHSCTSCEHSSIQLTHDTASDQECQNCSCEQHAKSCCDQSIKHEKNNYCCDYELVYLKNNPTTTLTKQSKAPLTNESILFIYQSFKFLALLTESSTTNQIAYHLHDPSEIDLEMLCTFRC